MNGEYTVPLEELNNIREKYDHSIAALQTVATTQSKELKILKNKLNIISLQVQNLEKEINKKDVWMFRRELYLREKDGWVNSEV